MPTQFPPYRRFEIVAPTANTAYEPHKFSAKHSEFMQFKALSLHAEADEQYKVVIEYPDKSSSIVNLNHECGNDICCISQTIEIRQNIAWSEAGSILIYIGVQVQNSMSTSEVRVVQGSKKQAFLVVSNIRKCFIKPC